MMLPNFSLAIATRIRYTLCQFFVLTKWFVCFWGRDSRAVAYLITILGWF